MGDENATDSAGQPIDLNKAAYDEKMKAFHAMPESDKIAIAAMIYSKQLQGVYNPEYKELSLKKILAACGVDSDKLDARLQEFKKNYDKQKDKNIDPAHRLTLENSAQIGNYLLEVLEVLRRYGLPWGLSEDQIRESFTVRFRLPDAPPAVEAFLFKVAKIIDEGPKLEARIGKEVEQRTSAFEEAVKLALSNLSDTDRAVLGLRLAAATGAKVKTEAELGRTKQALEGITKTYNTEKEEWKKRFTRVRGLWEIAHDRMSTLRKRASIAERTLIEVTDLYEGLRKEYFNLVGQLRATQKTLGEEAERRQSVEQRNETLEGDNKELDDENKDLYLRIEEFGQKVEGLTAALEVERKRAGKLEERLEKTKQNLEKTSLRRRTGWYAAGVAALIGLCGYIGWSQSERPNIIQIVQKTTPVEPVVPQPEPVETVQYLMGAFLVELPDKQFVVTGKKNADLENRAKSVSYLDGAYLVEFKDKKFALTADKMSALDKLIAGEKSKLGRDLTVEERKGLYEKVAAKYEP